MRKKVQYSDKLGMVVETGKEPEERVAPGVTMEAARPKVEKKAEATPKAEERAKKPSGDK